MTQKFPISWQFTFGERFIPSVARQLLATFGVEMVRVNLFLNAKTMSWKPRHDGGR